MKKKNKEYNVFQSNLFHSECEMINNRWDPTRLLESGQLLKSLLLIGISERRNSLPD